MMMPSNLLSLDRLCVQEVGETIVGGHGAQRKSLPVNSSPRWMKNEMNGCMMDDEWVVDVKRLRRENK